MEGFYGSRLMKNKRQNSPRPIEHTFIRNNQVHFCCICSMILYIT